MAKQRQKLVTRPWVYYVVRILFAPLFLLLFHPKYIGMKNIPKRGAFIFANNHKTALDQFIISARVNRTLHYLVAEKTYEKKGWGGKLLNFLLIYAGTIRVERFNKERNSALQYAVKYLERGYAVQINPEGTRNRGEKRQDVVLPRDQWKVGAVIASQRTGAPLIPAAIVGDPNIIGKRVILVIGKSLDVSNVSVDKGVDMLYNAIKKLLIKYGEKI
jgi:1-acyl-sn-glycerol-3-phosphate acyltransferase